MVIHPGEAQVGVGEAPQLAHRIVGRATARGDVVDERAQRGIVHDLLYPAQP